MLIGRAKGKALPRCCWECEVHAACKGGTVSLFIDDRKVGQGRLPFTNWLKLALDKTFDIGEDSGSPVSEDYAAPNTFTGTIEKVVIDAYPANLSSAD
jgi:hypothetical protein